MAAAPFMPTVSASPGFLPFLSRRKPTRIEHRWTDDGTKVRVSKRSGSVIPTPPEAIGKGKAATRSEWRGRHADSSTSATEALGTCAYDQWIARSYRCLPTHTTLSSLSLAEPGPRDTPVEIAHRVTYAPPAHLLPYLSASSDLFRVRGADDLRKPEPIRHKHVATRTIRNRVLASWRKGVDRQRMAELAREQGIPLPPQQQAAAAAGARGAGTVELR